MPTFVGWSEGRIARSLGAMLSTLALRRRPEDRMWFLDGLHTVHLRGAEPAADDRVARLVAEGASALRARGDVPAAAPVFAGWRR